MVAVAVLPAESDEPIVVDHMDITDLAQVRALLTDTPGYLELIPLHRLSCALLVLDERVMNGISLEFNFRATGLVSQWTSYQGFVVGNAVLVGIDETGDFADVPLEAITAASQRSTT